MRRDQYLAMRQEYMPDPLRLIFLCESPPASNKYFYDEDGKASETLFLAMMHHVLKCQPNSKMEGLTKFQSNGYLLTDATYRPVNEGLTVTARNRILEDDYGLLIEDLSGLDRERRVPILLIKAIVCRLLDSRLTADGFPVLNRGRPVYFPPSGQQPKFRQQISEILAEHPDLLP